MINISQYLYFLQYCTGLSEKTTKNYTDFKRINECLQSLFPERKEFSLEDIEDPSELEAIILQLQKLPLYIEYNEKGKNQYSATISTYLHFLYAKRMRLANKVNNISIEKKLIDSSRSNIQGEGLPRILNSAIKEALKIDKDLSKLKPEVTNKRLRIKRCNFAAELNNAKEIRPDKVNLDTVWKFHDKEYCVYNELSAENFSDFISQYNNAYFNTLSIEVENIDGSKIYNLYIFAHTPIITNTTYLPYLTALRTKPFMLLAGISGTGKSRIVREMAKACWTPEEDEYGKNCPRNFCMVQVKPNWHDSSDLIGYVSRINGEKYVVGPFLRFIAKAIKDPKRPYFLCLDEMNLAPVEQYFAEYLSVIESRKLQDGQIETDPIVPYENTEAYGSLIDQLFDSDEERKAYKTEEGGKRLTIPENLFVVGTVNMDETTFSFSRKVLDRAMTIEMNEVDLHGGLEAGGAAEFGYIGEDLIGEAAEGRDIYADNQALCEDVIEYLGKVNDILEGTPFKIAYRTRNEFLLYAVNRLHFAPESEVWQTLDEMTSMKILSRIEGDNERCEHVLRELKNLLTETVGDHAEDSASLKKIDEMTLKLKSGYTSYWA